MNCQQIIFSQHAVQRMFERGIQTNAIRAIIESGEVIGDYPDDQPFPSYLVLGYVEGRAIHVVIAIDAISRRCYIITAYIPDLDIWHPDFKTKRSL
jgi:hypothetical protein